MSARDHRVGIIRPKLRRDCPIVGIKLVTHPVGSALAGARDVVSVIREVLLCEEPW